MPTPTELNKAIRAGEIFYLPSAPHVIRPQQVLKAKSVGGLKGVVKVQVVNLAGAKVWVETEYIRRASYQELIFVRPEGERTWYKNA